MIASLFEAVDFCCCNFLKKDKGRENIKGQTQEKEGPDVEKEAPKVGKTGTHDGLTFHQLTCPMKQASREHT